MQLVKGEHKKLLSGRLTWPLHFRLCHFIVCICKAHFAVMNFFFNVERLAFLMLIYFEQYRMEVYPFSGLELRQKPFPISCIGVHKKKKKDINDLNVSWIIYIRGNDTTW